MLAKNRNSSLTSYPRKEEMVSKIEPFLKSGLSIRKAVFEAKISRATFYRMMDKDKDFCNKITCFRNYLSILISNALVKELIAISDKQANGYSLDSQDICFLLRFAKTRFCREEYGRKKNRECDSNLELFKLNELLRN